MMLKLIAALLNEWRVLRTQALHPLALRRVRWRWRQGQRLRVVFIVTEVAKWKAQSLYAAMVSSPRFEPVVCVSRPDLLGHESAAESQRAFDDCCGFFRSRGIPVEIGYDLATGQARKLAELQPDLIFYQQSWFSVREQLPYAVASRALSFYLPYFTLNYGDSKLECRKLMHRLVTANFVLNPAGAEIYRRQALKRPYVGSFVGLGQPLLDEIKFDPDGGAGGSSVIYAPHWTVGRHGETGHLYYGTFQWNGREILAYAQRHREIHWIFKPHPNFKMAVVKVGLMSADAVEAYYRAWAELGEVATGPYLDLFERSSAMITDCGSFLTEYAATGKPIIHLQSAENTLQPPGSLSALYATYYDVHDLEEMRTVFARVLEDRDDYRREERLAAVRAANIVGGHAAEAILNYIKEQILGTVRHHPGL